MQREGEAEKVGQGIATEAVLLFVVGWKEVADRRRYIDVLRSRKMTGLGCAKGLGE
jgi:hypothetical protein